LEEPPHPVKSPRRLPARPSRQKSCSHAVRYLFFWRIEKARPKMLPRPRNASDVRTPRPAPPVDGECPKADRVTVSVWIVIVVVAAWVPSGVTVAGLKLQVVFLGVPEHARLTCCANPPDGVMVIVDIPELPCWTVPLAGDRLMLKSAATAAVTVIATAADVDPA
jgi:hypothetical protein